MRDLEGLARLQVAQAEEVLHAAVDLLPADLPGGQRLAVDLHRIAVQRRVVGVVGQGQGVEQRVDVGRILGLRIARRGAEDRIAVVGPQRRPAGHRRAVTLQGYAVEDPVSVVRGHHDRRHVAVVLRAGERPGVLDLEDGLRRVLVAPLGLGQRIVAFVEVAVKLLKGLQGDQRPVPVLVPHGELCHQHQRQRIARTVVDGLRGAALAPVLGGEPRQCVPLQVIVQLLADFMGRGSGQAADFGQPLVGVDHRGVERHVAEHAGQHIVVKRAHHAGFGRQRHLHPVGQVGGRDALDALVAVHDAFVTLRPDVLAVLRLGGSHVEAGVDGRRGGVPDVGAGLGDQHEVGRIDRIRRHVTRIERRNALRLVLVERFAVDERGRLLRQRTGGEQSRREERQYELIEVFHLLRKLSGGFNNAAGC